MTDTMLSAISISERVPVFGFEHYTVDKEGNVYSPSGRPRKSRRLRDGYFYIDLHPPSKASNWVKGVSKTKAVHTIVLESFVCPRPSSLEARHLDGNPQNNRLENLKWGTRQENYLDKIRHGKEKHPFLEETGITQLKYGKWQVSFARRYYGVFASKDEALKRYREISRSHYGDLLEELKDSEGVRP